MDEVLHRQYEQYKRSKEGIRLINSRYHELKIQIADIRAERDRAKQDAALARMESGLRQYEAENKTGNPVLDTLLTAKSMDCQQRGINMTSVADGSQLGFLSTRELCTSWVRRWTTPSRACWPSLTPKSVCCGWPSITRAAA